MGVWCFELCSCAFMCCSLPACTYFAAYSVLPRPWQLSLLPFRISITSYFASFFMYHLVSFHWSVRLCLCRSACAPSCVCRQVGSSVLWGAVIVRLCSCVVAFSLLFSGLVLSRSSAVPCGLGMRMPLLFSQPFCLPRQ